MPTPGQHALFEKLERSYGDCPRWKHLTDGRDFDAMRTERASVYLAGLVAAFMQAHIGPCSCSSPQTWKTMDRAFRKAPGAVTPGTSDAHAV
jgi:hypothetical protein